MCTLGRGIFRRHVSMTRATSSAFRSPRVYHTSRIPPLTPFSSGVSKASGQILPPRISIFRPSSRQVHDPSLQRCPHDLDTLSYRARQQDDASRDVQLHETSFRSLTLSKRETKFLILFCRALRAWCDDARSRRSEWPTTRTRSRRVADREVDHVIAHRIVPLGAPQETNDEGAPPRSWLS